MLAAEDEKLLERLVETIGRWRMEVPAIFTLEMSKPLSFIGSQFMVVMGPIMHCFFAAQDYDRLAAIFNERENVELLIRMLERQAAQRD